MISSVKAALQTFLEQEKLPPEYLDTVEQWFMPMAERLLRQVAVSHHTFVVGISGCQGSGKSTLASLLVILFREMMGLSSIDLSLDDFYLTRAERQALAAQVHPLFLTRGVPGTHDVDLALSTIEALQGNGSVRIPRFNKAADDRFGEARWPMVQAPVDVVIFEGWCLNIPPQSEDALQEPVNELERNEDPQGIWRRHVNEKIRQDYQRLYQRMDALIMLRAPSFEKVYEWRQRQEDKLALAQEQQGAASAIMSQTQLQRFIQHYERLTRHGLEVLPDQADIVFQLTEEQTIEGQLK